MLRKERRKTRRLPIELSAEIRQVFFKNNEINKGMPIPSQITNIGAGGLNINLPNELDAGSRVFVSTKIHGERLEFYAMVKHASLLLSNPTPTYAHGLQITTAMSNILDDFDRFVAEFIQRVPKCGVVYSDQDDASLIGSDDDQFPKGPTSIAY
jgi:hypothetical protein